MDGINVMGFAYRRWALDIMEHLSLQGGIDVTVARTPGDVNLETIRAVNPDVLLFYGWSWIVSPEIIEAYTCLCLHPSPLPRYRGGSPIQHQIMEGESESAVSIFRMTDKLDAGDLCAQVPFSLDGDLFDILDTISYIGKQQTCRVLKEWQAGVLKFTPQEGVPTIFQRLTPEDSEITADELRYGTARFLYNKIRSKQAPYPLPFIRCADGEILYLTGALLHG